MRAPIKSAMPSPKRKLSEEEYLLSEDKATSKSEFSDGTRASDPHYLIVDNLAVEFGNRLKGTSCRGRPSDTRLKVNATGLYTYPDYLIVCGQAEFEVIQGIQTLLNPKVVFEVLSKSTEMWDRNLKHQQYEMLPSVQEYILIDQDMVHVEQYVREGELLKRHDATFDINAELVLTSIPVRVPIVDLYRDVTGLEPPPKMYSEDLS